MDERQFRTRVYYEDTDCMGVVYHANYLRFLERARTEYIAVDGPSVMEWAERNIMFPIYNINVTFKAPAKLGDWLVVVSRAKLVSPFRLSFEQHIERESDHKVLVEAKVDVVCTDLKGSLRDFPQLERRASQPVMQS